jgi:hypothetical protein
MENLVEFYNKKLKNSYIFTIKKHNTKGTPMKVTHEKETHLSKCCEYFLQQFGVLNSNTKKKKAKDICIKYLAVSCCMLVCFMAITHKRICNTIEMWKQFAKFKE